MPYIKQERRPDVSPNAFAVPAAENAGELNYQVTELINLYLDKHVLSYAAINAVVGALESAKLEFYRRVAVPFEDQKKHDNGDVY